MANFGSPRRPLNRAAREPTVFEQLLELKWRSVSIPCSSIRVTLDHDLVFHKYYGVDGVNIEDTGLEGLKFEATIPLFNTIAAAPQETWGSTRLFPDQFQRLWTALLDKSTGELQHPLWGAFDCKVQQAVFPLEGDKREGSEITASWVQTTPLLDQGENDRYRGGPVLAANQAAIDLDASIADLRGRIPETEIPLETFESMITKITGTLDRLSMSATLLANKPAQLAFRLNRLQNSVERLRDASTWPTVEACEKLRDALRALAPGSSQDRRIKRYTVPATTTLAMIANTLRADIMELMKLNPDCVRQPDVQQGTIIRHFG